MELFNVVTSGQLLPGFLPDQVLTKLTNLKVPPPLARKLVEEVNACIVKKQVSLPEAKKLQARLECCGLKAHIYLQLSPTCLSLGLHNRSRHPPQEKDSTQSPSVLLLNNGLLQPTLFTGSGTFNLDSSERSQKAVVQKIGYSWNPIPLLMAVLLIAVHCEMFLVRFLSSYLQLNLAASLLGIGFLIVTAMFLPRLLQPLGCFILNYASLTPRLIKEDNSLQPFRKRYCIFNPKNDVVGVAIRSSATAAYYDGSGELRYTWSKLATGMSSSDDEVEIIQQDAVSDHMTGPLSDYLDLVYTLFSLFRRTPKITDDSWRTAPGTAVRDTNGKLVATIIHTPCPAIRIMLNKTNQDQQADLLCFALAILRPSI